MTIATWGDEITVSPWAGSHLSPYVTTLTGGRLLIVWAGDNDDDDGFGDPDHGIQGRLFHADGLPVGDGGAFLINTTKTGDQLQPEAVGFTNGGYAVVWEDYSSGVGSAVRSRYGNLGGPLGVDEQWGNVGQAVRPHVDYSTTEDRFLPVLQLPQL
jgi:hypothetical protein